MQFSKYGNKYTKISGISSLMQDLGSALSQESDIVFMGGGNPAHIDEVYKKFSAQIQSISTNEESYKRFLLTIKVQKGILSLELLFQSFYLRSLVIRYLRKILGYQMEANQHFIQYSIYWRENTLMESLNQLCSQ